jgi:hypothetical protein
MLGGRETLRIPRRCELDLALEAQRLGGVQHVAIAGDEPPCFAEGGACLVHPAGGELGLGQLAEQVGHAHQPAGRAHLVDGAAHAGDAAGRVAALRRDAALREVGERAPVRQAVLGCEGAQLSRPRQLVVEIAAEQMQHAAVAEGEGTRMRAARGRGEADGLPRQRPAPARKAGVPERPRQIDRDPRCFARAGGVFSIGGRRRQRAFEVKTRRRQFALVQAGLAELGVRVGRKPRIARRLRLGEQQLGDLPGA